MDGNFDINSLMRPPRVCLCKNVSAEDIRRCVKEEGIRNLKGLIKTTRASTGCGTCILDVRRELASALEELEHPLFHQDKKAD